MINLGDDSITITSPNGLNRITLRAMDSTAGLWISFGIAGAEVAIYNDETQGPVVGLYDKGKESPEMTVALASKGGPRLQVRYPDGTNKVIDLLHIADKQPQ